MMEVSSPDPIATGPTNVPSRFSIWRRPLPRLRGRPVTRGVCRTLLSIFHRQVLSINGLEHVSPDKDPFILALNHSQGPEAVLAPTWLCFHRGGRMIHFMADWNFLLWPVLGWVIQLHEPIVVTHKPAKPKFLNRLRPWYEPRLGPMEAAADFLRSGRSVGMFPEATVNRHPTQLLRGQLGLARLAVDTGAPVVPGGIRFPEHRGEGPIENWEPFTIHFGPPLAPPLRDGDTLQAATRFHEQIMSAISTLSGKKWQPHARRTKYAFPKA